MKQMQTSIVLWLLAASVSLGLQCDKEYNEPKLKFAFAEKLSLSPYQKEYRTGDTIWVQFQTADDKLFDIRTGKRVEVDTSFLGLIFYFRQRYPVAEKEEVFGAVAVDQLLGVDYETVGVGLNGLFCRTDCVYHGPYFFRMGFVPQKTGIYSIESRIEFTDCIEKVNRGYSMFQFTFDLQDVNKDVWFSIPANNREAEGSNTEKAIDNKEIFVFRVK